VVTGVILVIAAVFVRGVWPAGMTTRWRNVVIGEAGSAVSSLTA
jgi:hypothetical protein